MIMFSIYTLFLLSIFKKNNTEISKMLDKKYNNSLQYIKDNFKKFEKIFFTQFSQFLDYINTQITANMEKNQEITKQKQKQKQKQKH